MKKFAAFARCMRLHPTCLRRSSLAARWADQGHDAIIIGLLNCILWHGALLVCQIHRLLLCSAQETSIQQVKKLSRVVTTALLRVHETP